MGFASAWKSLTSGDASTAFNNLLTSEDALDTQKLVANAQEANIQRQYNEGLVDEQEAGELMNLSAGSAYPYLWQNEPGGDPATTFADTVKANTGKLWDTALGAPGKLLPWWVWALILVGSLIYFWPILRTALAFRGKM